MAPSLQQTYCPSFSKRNLSFSSPQNAFRSGSLPAASCNWRDRSPSSAILGGRSRKSIQYHSGARGLRRLALAGQLLIRAQAESGLKAGTLAKAIAGIEGTETSQPSAASAEAQKLSLAFGTFSLPHPDKADYGGEDAHFVSSSSLAMGVADGVGGWSADGINPAVSKLAVQQQPMIWHAEYSRMLMRLVQESLEAAIQTESHPSSNDLVSSSSERSNGGSSAEPQGEPATGQLSKDAAASTSTPEKSEVNGGSSAQPEASTPSSPAVNGASEHQNDSQPILPSVQMLREALAHAHKGTRLPGSSTACVLQLNLAASNVNAAVLGDSIFMHVRNGQVLNRARPGLHFFDCPFQFGNAPEHTSGTDTADDADMYTFDVRHGDVMVVATDGIWDNMQDADILQLVPSSSSDLDQAAQAIGELASRNATDSEYNSPYAAEARKAGHDLPWWERLLKGRMTGEGFKPAQLTGGKLDDITVVVCMVTSGQ